MCSCELKIEAIFIFKKVSLSKVKSKFLAPFTLYYMGMLVGIKNADFCKKLANFRESSQQYSHVKCDHKQWGIFCDNDRVLLWN